MFGLIKVKRLKKVKSVTIVYSDCFMLNILVDLGNYYGITSGKFKLCKDDILEYISELNSVLAKFSSLNRKNIVKQVFYLTGVLPLIQDKRFTFSKLVNCYLSTKIINDYEQYSIEVISCNIINSLGSKPVYLNRSYVQERIKQGIVMSLVKCNMDSLHKELSTSVVRNTIPKRLVIDSSINYYVDYDKFFSNTGSRTTVSRLLTYTLKDANIDCSSSSVESFYNSCLVMINNAKSKGYI